MAVLKREDFFSRLESQIHNDTSDEAISFLEDMQDTYNDLERRANGDGVDWEKKYHELDDSWKARYRHRFFSGSGYNPRTPEPDSDEPEENFEDAQIDDLFKESEVK